MSKSGVSRKLAFAMGFVCFMIAGREIFPAAAAERTGLNLGATSFFDGFASMTPGCVFILYVGRVQFYQLNGPDGDKLLDMELGGTYGTPQLACNSSLKLFTGVLGWNTVAPLSHQESNFFSTNGGGLGDVVTGPYIQFPPVMREGRPVFSHGFEFDFIAPTGLYSPERTINPGNDYWSLSPFWKATLLPAPQWEISWRLHYLYNFDHRTYINAAGPGGASVQKNGDGVWLNFTGSREVFKDFYFGLNGYWLKQLEADAAPGDVKLPDARQETLYLGPGVHYTIDTKNIVNFNVYYPVVNINAPSGGFHVNFMYVHPLN